MQHDEFLRSLSKMATGNVYKRNSAAKKPYRESTVFQSDLSQADMARGFQPLTKKHLGHSNPEPNPSETVSQAKRLLQALQEFLAATSPQQQAQSSTGPTNPNPRTTQQWGPRAQEMLQFLKGVD